MFKKSLLSFFNRKSIQLGKKCYSSQVELTSNKYGKDKRGNYSHVEKDDVLHFESILGNTRVITDTSDLEGYNVDWFKTVRGESKLLLKPKTTEEVRQILKHCNERRLAVTPQGGNTGVVGGCIPVFDEIIISTALMNRVISLDEWSNVLICEPGCILENLSNYLGDKGLIMPVDLGAKGSCTIGGNVSTNAGGLRLIRYGSLHSTVLGVEAVLADGTILDLMSEMKKDNTGYDLKHLFIGSEGSLGLITKVAIQCPTKSNSLNLAFLGMSSYENVLTTFVNAKRELGEILSSCEYMDEASVDAVRDNLPELKVPIGRYPFYMLIETSGSNAEHDSDKVNKFLEKYLEKGIFEDGAIATEPSKYNEFWAIRERVPNAFMQDGYFYAHDFSIPIKYFDEFIQTTRKHLENEKRIKRITGMGHLGDSNIHLNITTSQHWPEVTNLIHPFVYELTAKYKGSISAEHGIGFKKRSALHFTKSPEAISLMGNIKNIFDPNFILNPYKVLPDN